MNLVTNSISFGLSNQPRQLVVKSAVAGTFGKGNTDSWSFLLFFAAIYPSNHIPTVSDHIISKLDQQMPWYYTLGQRTNDTDRALLDLMTWPPISRRIFELQQEKQSLAKWFVKPSPKPMSEAYLRAWRALCVCKACMWISSGQRAIWAAQGLGFYAQPVIGGALSSTRWNAVYAFA